MPVPNGTLTYYDNLLERIARGLGHRTQPKWSCTHHTFSATLPHHQYSLTLECPARFLGPRLGYLDARDAIHALESTLPLRPPYPYAFLEYEVDDAGHGVAADPFRLGLWPFGMLIHPHVLPSGGLRNVVFAQGLPTAFYLGYYYNHAVRQKRGIVMLGFCSRHPIYKTLGLNPIAPVYTTALAASLDETTPHELYKYMRFFLLYLVRSHSPATSLDVHFKAAANRLVRDGAIHETFRYLHRLCAHSTPLMNALRCIERTRTILRQLEDARVITETDVGSSE